MKHRLRFAALAMAAAVPLTGLSTGVASAVNIGMEGCTPGYWKNHVQNWEEYKPTTQLQYVFTTLKNTKYAKVTLRDALSYKGGSGVDGATQILLRAAAAAVLNAAHEGVGYPYRRFRAPFEIVAQVNATLTSKDRQRMLTLASTLDAANNLGCPLS